MIELNQVDKKRNEMNLLKENKNRNTQISLNIHISVDLHLFMKNQIRFIK